MKPTIDIYCGSPIENESEQSFLHQLSANLSDAGIAALIFANFFPPKNPLQIDFLVVVGQTACHIELKGLTAPVVGGVNGPWTLKLPDGSVVPLDAANPYHQALAAKFAISDQMHAFARFNSVPVPDAGRKFYRCLESVVCVYPDLLPGSSVYSDYKVQVLGFPKLLTLLRNSTTNPGWTRENWIDFAMHMGLVRSENQQDRSPPELTAAQGSVYEYLGRLTKHLADALPAHVPTTIRCNKESLTTDQIESWANRGEHLHVVGPSGSGKTLLVKHMALQAAREERIPIIVRARDYDRKLSQLLDRSVASFHPNTATHLVAAANRICKPLLLVVDGFNECPTRLQTDLLRDIQALYLRWHIPVIFTSQARVPVDSLLAGPVVEFDPLNASERLAVLHAYCRQEELCNSAERVITCFKTPYDLSVAAECLQQFERFRTRSALFDAYIQRRCDNTHNPEVARAILRAIAARMHSQLTSSLPAFVARQIALAVVARESVQTTLVGEAFSCGVVEIHQGSCAYRHELLERFLQAEAVAESRDANHVSPFELAAPRNRPLAEFIVSAETEPETLKRELEQLADPSMFVECVRGHWGALPRQIMHDECGRLLAKALASLMEVDVDLQGDPGDYADLILSGGPKWAPYEIATFDCIGQDLPSGVLLERVLRLARNTWNHFSLCVSTKRGSPGTLSMSDTASLFAALFVYRKLGGPVTPVSIICGALHSHLSFGMKAAGDEPFPDLMEGIADRTPAELLVLVYVLRNADDFPCRNFADFLRHCWKRRIYHLRLEALELAELTARRLNEDTRAEVASFLSSLPSNNIFLNTAIVDAMYAYDMIDSPVTSDDAAQLVQNIAQSPDDDTARQAAYGAISNIFEDLYQGAYYEAYHNLAPADKVRLLCKAAMGVPEYSSWRDWILEELVRLDDSEAAPVFQRWASEINPKTSCSHETIACYLLAVIGCARSMDSPPPLTTPQTEEAKAWEVYGAIVFWTYDKGISNEHRQALCHPMWHRLSTEFAFEAVDPLFRMKQAAWKGDHGYLRVLTDLCMVFPEYVRKILEFGVSHLTELTSLFPSYPGDGLREFIIGQLGVVGTQATVKQLDSLANDAQVGLLAVESIRAINSRNS